MLEERTFPGAGDPSRLLPPRSRDTDPFRDGLRERRLVLRRCAGCGRARHPPAPVCPYCLCAAADWSEVPGTGHVHSWIRYRRAYLPEYEPLMPYVVVCAELDDGPRLFGRLCDRSPGREPWSGMPLRAIVERCASGECLLGFVAAVVEESAARE